VPDLLDFEVVRLDDSKTGMPRWQVTGRVVDSSDQSVERLAFTGKAPFTLPDAISLLPPDEQDEIARDVAMRLMMRSHDELVARSESEDEQAVKAELEQRAEASTEHVAAVEEALKDVSLPAKPVGIEWVVEAEVRR